MPDADTDKAKAEAPVSNELRNEGWTGGMLASYHLCESIRPEGPSKRVRTHSRASAHWSAVFLLVLPKRNILAPWIGRGAQP